MKAILLNGVQKTIKGLTEEIDNVVRDTVYDQLTSEDRLGRINEIDETLMIIAGLVNKLTKEQEELQRQEDEYQAEQELLKEKVQEMKNMFKKEEAQKPSNKTESTSVKGDINELKQARYEILDELNRLNSIIGKTTNDLYKIKMLNTQLEGISEFFK
jgi:septal ring factor EnvC (AmiA/AmiB activator)